MINKIFRDLVDRVQDPGHPSVTHVVHCDYLGVFRVSGTVMDAKTKNPVEGAILVFIDSGLDHIRSAHGPSYAVPIGVTNKLGAASVEHTYTWGQIKEKPGPPTGHIRIQIEAPSYHTSAVQFQLANLKGSGREYQVDLGTFQLSPR